MQVGDAPASVDTRPNDGPPAEVLDWSSISQQCVGNGCAETLPQGYSMALCPKCIQAMNNVSTGTPQQQGHGPSVRGWRPPAVPETPTPMPPMPMRMPSSPTKAMYSPPNPYPPGGARIRPLPVFRGPQMAQSPAIQHRGPHGMPQNQPRFYPTRPKIVAPHFNARGEILEPPQYPQDLFPLYEPRRSMNAWPYPPTHPLRPRHPMRMCPRHGCGANIPPHSPSELCSRCITAIQAERHQHRAQMRVQTGESLKHNRLPGGTADAPIDIDMLDGTESKPQELRSHLPTPPTSSCSPTMPTIEIPEARKPTKPLPKKAPSVKLKLTIPRQHQDPSSSASASGSGYLLTPDTAPTAHNVPTPNASTSGYPLGRPKKLPRKASCSSPGCAQPLEPDSVSGRCANCIRHHWKTRPERKLLRNLQRRKRVTWAEDVDGGDTALGGGDGGDGVTTDAEEEDGRMDVEESRSGSSTPISNDEGGIMGWDSDLTDLEEGAAGDSSDEAASEEEPGDLDEDVDEEEEVAAALQLTGLKIRIPRRVSISEPGANSSITKIEPPPETLPSSSTTPEPPFTDSAATSATTSATPEPRPSISVTPELQIAEGPSTPPILCAIRSCSAPLAPGYRWKSCISCRLRTREYQRKRQGITGRQIRLDSDTTANDFHPSHQHRPDELVPGARLCSIKRCIHVLPSKEEYRWKLCEGCRARMRNQARKRRRKEKAKEKKAALGESNTTNMNMDVDSGDDTDDSLVKPFHASPRSAEERENLPPGRCLSRDCGMLVPEDAPEPLCRQCRVRRGKPLKLKLKPPRDCMRNGVNSKPPPYPECQNSQTLISTFKHRLREFFHVQLLYLHLKSKKQQQMTDDEKAEGGKETKPIALDFRFAGEFSVVALDYEIEKRMDEVKERHAKIKDALAERTKLEFHPSMWISVMEDGGGIITRFVCIYASEQPALLADINPPTKVKAEEETPEPTATASSASPAPAPQPPAPTISAFTPTIAGTTPATISPSRTSPAIVTKPMRGELEIASFPDRTHLLFPGERTIVRFRLVG